MSRLEVDWDIKSNLLCVHYSLHFGVVAVAVAGVDDDDEVVVAVAVAVDETGVDDEVVIVVDDDDDEYQMIENPVLLAVEDLTQY